MNSKGMKISVVLCFLICLGVQGQEKRKMSIQQLLNHALKESFDLNEARLNVEKSIQLKNETKSNGLPQLSGNVKYEQYIDQPVMILPGSLMAGLMPPSTGTDPNSGDQAGTGQMGTSPDIVADYGKAHNVDIGIQASQLLFSMQYIYGVKTASKAIELYQLRETLSETDLIHAMYSNYYSLLSIHKNLEIIENNISSLTKLKDISEALVKAELSLNTDLNRLKVNLANLETAKRQALSGINIQTNNLKMLAGIKRSEKIEIEVFDLESIYKLSNLKLKEAANFNSIVDNRLEVQLLNKQLELNDLQIKTEKGAHTPTIAAYYTYIKQAQENEFNIFSNNATWRSISLLGIKAEIPIFSGRKTNAKIKQSKINKQITLNQKEKAIEGLNVEYLNASSEYNISFSNCFTHEKSIELAKDVLEQEQLKYQEGLSGLTDVLLAETELRTTESNFIQEMTKLKLAELKLLKTQGKLTSLINN